MLFVQTVDLQKSIEEEVRVTNIFHEASVFC